MLLAEELGDQQERALALLNLGVTAMHQGNHPIARDRYEAALEHTHGNTHSIVATYVGLGVVAIEEGNLELAETNVRQALALARELASKHEIAYALLNLGDVATQLGRYQRADDYLRESLTLARALGDQYLLLGGVAEHAKLAAAWGQAARAARLGGAEAGLRDDLGIALPVGEIARRERALARARTQLGEHDFRRAWEDGQAMELEEAVACALDERAAASRNRDHAPSASPEVPAPRPHSRSDPA